MATSLITLQNLVTPLSSTTIRQMLVKSLVGVGIRADLWLAGGIASTLLTYTATILALCSSGVANFVSGFFLPLASGAALSSLAYYVYGVTVPAATFASGNLLLVNSGGGVYNIPVGGYVASNGTYSYTNTAAFTLLGGASVTVPMSCTTQGSVGSSAPLTITQQVTNLLGVSCTNPASFVGLDAPSDPAIRQLCLNALGAMSVRGPRTAYQYAVQTAINSVSGAPVNINRWSVSGSSHTGQVTIYIASPSGPVDPNDLTAVVNNVEAIARPMCVTAYVIACSIQPDNDIYNIYCIAPVGVSSSTLLTQIENDLVTFFENYPIGGIAGADNSGSFQGLFQSGVAAQIGASLIKQGAQLISLQGANDYSMAVNSVLSDKTTAYVNIVSTPSGTFGGTV